MANYASKLIEIATAEVGYLEKASNSNLDSKTGNAGSGNWTKYARDLAKIEGFYNGNKNGYAWCAVFVSWCFVQAFGVAEAKKLLNHGQYAAGCVYAAQYFRDADRYYQSPKVGDVIFFGSKGDEYHTGIVYKVDKDNVYTIEGNTSGDSGVVANGGGVFKKSYTLDYYKIAGYGRPSYDAEPVAEEKKPTPAPTVAKLIAGQAVALKNEPLYGSSDTTKVAAYIYGPYYLWSATVINGRIRITDSKDHVGKWDWVVGWIKAPESTNRNIRQGDTVKLNKGAKTYTGGSLNSYVYDRAHVVKELSDDRAVITYGGVVVAAVNVKDLTLV